MSSWCKVVLPEVTWLAVMWPEVTWPEVRKYVLRMSRAFFLTRVVVPRLPEVTNGHVTLRFSLCVRMHNLKLHNIYPTGAFLPEVTLWMSSEWVVEGVCACTTVISALVGPFHRKYPLGCSLGRPHLSFSSPG